MDDLGRPIRRQASSSRRSSTQRIRPRARASNQSLQSAGRPQENTTFTSFEPFSPPNNITSSYNSNASTTANGLSVMNGNGSNHGSRDDASIRSYSSSKRSRSIYAPDRQNSLAEDIYGEVAASSGNETEAEAASGSEQDTRPLDQVSAASHSLINVLNMAPKDESRPPLFNDVNDQLNNPQVLQNADDKTVVAYVKRQGGAGKVIRRLAKDVSDRDAEISRLRRKVEDFGTLFKDHLMAVHEMSRLEADRTVRDSPVFAKAATNDLKEELESASSDNLFGEAQATLSTDSLTVTANSQDSVPPLVRKDTSASPSFPSGSSTIRAPRHSGTNLKVDTNRMPKQRGGLFNLFGGQGSLRQPTKQQNRHSIASMLDPRMLGIRSPSVAQSTRSNSMSSYKPLEMEQKIENEDLPPPLLDMKVIKIIFRAFIADNYGFIIDGPRVQQWLWSLERHRYVPKSRTTSIVTRATSGTRSASITSIEEGDDEEATDIAAQEDAQNDGNAETNEESRPWHEFLTLEVTKQALLSRLPIQLHGPKMTDSASISSVDTDDGMPRLEQLCDPADFTTHAERLRDEISVEYTQLQVARDQAYDRLMAKVEEPKLASNRFSRIFTNTTETVPKNRVEAMGTSTVGIANLAQSGVSGPFVKFVLDGIPMKTRAKIWLESAQSSIHYSPEDFTMLATEYHTHPDDQRYLHDIEMDTPRTLTNNVYFRKEKNQDALALLLGCFAIRNKDIGYCQGFNIIAGYLLLAMPTTEQAFWVFCFLIEKVLPASYFTAEHDWQGPRADTIVLRHYIRTLLPRLGTHLDELDVLDEQTVPINWFLTAFASTLSVEALFRVWDVVLGIPGQNQQVFLLHVAIALLKLNEDELLKLDSAAAVYDYMDRKMARGVVTIDGLIQASSRLGPIVTAKSVEKRRAEAAKTL
ncbi:TBC-domain-containing protein [Aureobasidium pullulans]|uniref:TBC-domain-containing protein n=1 Tax=Aureobasidium pullulans TaxID=5580 RepID=A0A4S8ZPA5_AURPU|nr:TBC-domain-containing protein [Aureobasidium pullulans]THW57149.1 TBC-domain-containing protein [Aureobasidium pullulans]THW67929.1 TBC-domain-containing protein [Aureobasidium pullulans]THW84528.1 TBC-domain-containing protein [Aureobasidium pullulans]THX15916.1 TBC-domain-containing protein [Aureobasidium pullulans]